MFFRDRVLAAMKTALRARLEVGGLPRSCCKSPGETDGGLEQKVAKGREK